jgi:hypothetical protein
LEAGADINEADQLFGHITIESYYSPFGHLTNTHQNLNQELNQ